MNKIMKMYAVGYIYDMRKMLPDIETEDDIWALFSTIGNAREWAKEHGYKLKIRKVKIARIVLGKPIEYEEE